MQTPCIQDSSTTLEFRLQTTSDLRVETAMDQNNGPIAKCRWSRENWLRGQDLNLRPSGYEGDFTQPADGRRPSCFQSSRVLSSSAKSTEVHAGIRKSPPVWTRSGQSFGEPLRTGDLRLGNEPFRCARTFRMFPESARPCDFIRICRQHGKSQPVPRRLTVSAGAARLPARTDVDERGPTGGCTEVIRSCTAPGARLRAGAGPSRRGRSGSR